MSRIDTRSRDNGVFVVKVWRYEEANSAEYYGGWFITFIDTKGCLAVLSDYGDYSYRWSGSGDIRKSLLNFNDDYVFEKLGYNVKSEIDGESVRKRIREYILQQRREGGLRQGNCT